MKGDSPKHLILKTPVLTEKVKLLQTDDRLPGEVQVLCDSK